MRASGSGNMSAMTGNRTAKSASWRHRTERESLSHFPARATHRLRLRERGLTERRRERERLGLRSDFSASIIRR